MKKLLLFVLFAALGWAQITTIPSAGGGAGISGSAAAGDIAVFTSATAIGGAGNAGTLTYATANTNYATPLLKLNNPTTGTAETISFLVNGTERGRISQNNLGSMVISSDIQGAGSGKFIISTFDVGAATTNNIQFCTGCGAGGISGNRAGAIEMQTSAGNPVSIQSTRVDINPNGLSNTSTDSTISMDLWENPSGDGLRLRNGTSTGSNAANVPFKIVNTTLNSPTVLASIGPLAQPASVGTSPGTNELTAFSLTGGGGGNTTSTVTSVGGNAGAVSWTLGNGGTANSVTGAHNDTGGNGGGFSWTAGNGANATATDTGTNLGGNGGSFTFNLGSGGTASGGSTNTSGTDGSLIAQAGARTNADILHLQSNGGTALYRYDAFGRPHVPTNASTTVGTCGTSPSIAGNDAAGLVTTGSSATTACTVTFATTWTNAPFCVATSAGAVPGVVAIQAVSAATNLVLTYASATSAKIAYHCIGN